MKNGTPVDRQRGPPTGLGITAVTPTPGAVIPGTKSQAGNGERRLGNRGDSKLGTGRVQRNVNKSDTGGARRDRHHLDPSNLPLGCSSRLPLNPGSIWVDMSMVVSGRLVFRG